jgi:hypothetical protein
MNFESELNYFPMINSDNEAYLYFLVINNYLVDTGTPFNTMSQQFYGSFKIHFGLLIPIQLHY